MAIKEAEIVIEISVITAEEGNDRKSQEQAMVYQTSRYAKNLAGRKRNVTDGRGVIRCN
ncbi:hypothetical protein JWG42_05535 [Desulfoprunum benzoelyticum]|uniref:Uncharacterized protein n=1 Tax=Desulfoprunum benzoelyticum TaxID=1506996 RepID=A0A840UP23_9BACT|nr:hypothetical protein [Desulfoprunum benzoelyticum]MBB5347512.1 hypothetical protein [Desulfoprunum benzoelyticum]MBM9529611.1 hypothetical protein [Desulfoprunum benzoelyticum]